MAKSRSLSVFLLLCLLALFFPNTAPAVVWENLSFQQITYQYDEPENNVEFSTIGRCQVDYAKDGSPWFLNVSAEIPGLSPEPVWIVRNLLLGDITMGPPEESIGVQFPLSDLGVEEGMSSAEIRFGYTLTLESMADDEMAMFLAMVPRDQMVVVDQIVYEMNQGVPAADNAEEIKTGEQDPSSYVSYGGQPGYSVNSWIGCHMPNIPLDHTQPGQEMDKAACAPASCTNSLEWLDSQHTQIDVPDNHRALLKQLSNLMNRAQGKGASAEVMARAKLDFIEAHGLPIHVKIQDVWSTSDITSSSGQSTATNAGGTPWPTAEWLKSESQHGEDVEICVGYWYKDGTGWHRHGGHAVVISGTGTTRGKDWIAYKHDRSQGSSSGTQQDEGKLVPTSDGIKVVGMGGSFTPDGSTTSIKLDAYLESVVSESYDDSVTPPDTEESFDSYCDYITRTIKPGGHLTLDFPTSSYRSRDVTIYQVDRNQNPPTQRSLWRWTDNAGKQRTINNPTDICITVKIHNDDMDGDFWFGYIPYTLTLHSSSKDVASPEPSNFEETGGFSLGGRDGVCEFGPALMPSMMVDYTPEVMLEMVPATLGTPGGTTILDLHCQIPMWNKYWAELGFIVDVLTVNSPGDLLVDCPNNGFSHIFNITTPGRYRVMLGGFAPAADFFLHLEAMPGLEFTFDAIGVPTLVSYLSPVEENGIPQALFLDANHPNPFNPVTTIRFGVTTTGQVELAIFDLKGRRITTLFQGEMEAGVHRRDWAGTDAAGRSVAAGTYIYRLETEDGVMQRKMTLVK